MTAATMSAALQQLAMDGIVELYELDTSPLFTINGQLTDGATVYRWTSGIIEVRGGGHLQAGQTQTQTVLTLDGVPPLQLGRSYQVAVGTYPDNVLAPVPVASWASVGGFTQLTLALALSAVPTAGMDYCVFGTNPVTFRGLTYTPMPIDVTGWEMSASGKLPRPKLRVSNIGGLAAALVITYGDLLGAQITRIRTLREFLDDSAQADPTSFASPDVFVVDRKSSLTKEHLELELAAGIDQQGRKLPRRVMTRDSCNLTYRQWVTAAGGTQAFVYGSCPYTGAAMFDVGNVGTLDPKLDVCSLRQTGCTLRFGESANLPFSAFPGITIS